MVAPNGATKAPATRRLVVSVKETPGKNAKTVLMAAPNGATKAPATCLLVVSATKGTPKGKNIYENPLTGPQQKKFETFKLCHVRAPKSKVMENPKTLFFLYTYYIQILIYLIIFIELTSTAQHFYLKFIEVLHPSDTITKKSFWL